MISAPARCVDLVALGMAHEPTVREAVGDGAGHCDVFRRQACSADRRPASSSAASALIATINRNPMKRALRVDKIRLAAIGGHAAALSRPRSRSPSVCRLCGCWPAPKRRSKPSAPPAARRGGERRRRLHGEVVECASQIGSGALPLDTIASAGLAIRPRPARRRPRAGRGSRRPCAGLACSGDRADRGWRR